MVVSYIPRRYRNVAFKLLFIAAFVYLISVALSLSQSDSHPTAGIFNRLRVKPDQDPVIREHPSPQEEGTVGVSENKEDVTEDEEEDEEEYDEPEPPPPVNPKAPGEMGKPYKVDKPTGDVKKAIDKGWKDNAYNQYVSDLISLHR